MGATRVCGRRVEQGLVGHAGVDGPLHSIIDAEDLVLRTVVAVALDVLQFHYIESLLDVIGCITIESIEVVESGVKFGLQPSASFDVP